VAASVERSERRPYLRVRITWSLQAATFLMLLATTPVAAGDRFPARSPWTLAKSPAAADSIRTKGRNFVLVYAGVTRWEGVHALVPVPSSFSVPFDDRFDADGGSFGVSIQRGVRRNGQWTFYIGGDLGAFSHESPSRNAGPPDPELGQLQAQMTATAGYLTLSVRAVWPSNKFFTLHASTGLGVYVLMIQDPLTLNTGPNDTGNDARSPGGYLGFGFDAALTRWVGVHAEGRVHTFRFRDIGPSYPGQSESGPSYELLVGLSNWSIPW
jgi:hypothetical protein